MRFAAKALRVNLMRTVLSLLGVSVGILCIVGTSALFDSVERGIEESFSMIGDDLVFVQKMPMGPEEGDEEYEWWKYMARRNPQVRDAELLAERLSTAEAVSFVVKSWKTIQFGNSSLERVPTIGVMHPYNRMVNVNLSDGRWFTELEVDGGRPVCILGQNVVDGLFGPQTDPIGNAIKVAGLKLEVIGRVEKQGNGLMPESPDDAVLIPVDFARRLVDLRNAQEVNILVKARAGVEVAEMKDEVVAKLRPIRGVKPGQQNDFSVMEASFLTEMVDTLFGYVDIAGIVIGMFALLVGGFGVLNIMYVSVRERTNQIGIQKSLGARRSFILWQFLVESVFLCLIGAFAALLLIWLLFLLASSILEFTFSLSLSNVLSGIGISTAIGLIAGFTPARNAARMNPVDAIRFK